MKRIAITLTMILAVIVSGVAQNSKVVTAYNYHRQGKLAEAKEAIDQAVLHDKTSTDAKAWFYRGNIYYDIAANIDSNIRALSTDGFRVSYDSYNKATEYDSKGKYTKEITPRIKAVAEGFYNEGVFAYNNGDYVDAAKSFEKAYRVNIESGAIDTTSLYNAAVSAEIGEDYELAKTYYIELLDLNFPNPDLYSSLTEIYKKTGDTATALEVITKGRTLYPDNFNLLIAETNIYLGQNNTEKALANLEEAIEVDKSNATIWFAVGTNYDQLGIKDKAIAAYVEAIALRPDYFEANYNLGALYVNQAAEIIEKANDLPLDEVDEYEAAKAEAEELLRTSLPYLEKAHELQPEDTNTLISLKEIYTRIGEMDKVKEINEKLGY